MISWRDSKFHRIENPDEAVLDTSYRQFVLQVSDTTHLHDNGRLWGKSMLYTEDEKPKNDSAISDDTQHLSGPCSSFHDQDYIENIKKFQFYIDMVKEMAKPGCSPETLDMALSSISSLFKTLSVMASKHYIHASL